MDIIISTALEEICAEGAAGISLPKLWRSLRGCLASSGLEMDDSVKEAIWRRLLTLPVLQFSVQAALLDPWDPSIESAEQSEKLELKVAAVEHVRHSFLGIYDLKAANVEITPLLKQVLERVAVARSDGIAQSQLSKEFKMKENKLFYFLKKLESQGLIVRQSTILRTKEVVADGDDGMKDGSVVHTNLIRLYRYAKRLGSLQRFEIAKADASAFGGNPGESHLTIDGTCGESLKEDVHVKDYLPEMKAICDMLEEASGKVLIVSDVKVARGYRMKTGHRSWRNICNRMKEALLVEEFPAKVDGKVVKCLRLLKNFNPKDFQPKTVMCGYEGDHFEHLPRCSRRGQVTDQIVELPIEHHIYDIIAAEGPKGITIPEVSRRLGLNNKRTEARICDMCWRMPKRFPMHMQFENHHRTKIYRVWTLENFECYLSSVASSNRENNLDGTDVSGQCDMDIVPCEQSSIKNPQTGLSLQELHHERIDGGQIGCALPNPNVSLFLAENGKSVLPVADPDCQLPVSTKDAAPSERSLSVLSSSKVHSSQKSPLASSVDSAQRERRILSKLKNEKFLLKVELHKWLEGLENDKQTTMARKTLTRSLQRLQQEGHCKCIQVSVPALTNCKRSRATEVILHPSVENLTSELLAQIHKRLRDSDMQTRGQGLRRQRNDGQDVTELQDVKRHSNHGVSDAQSGKAETMRMNGYVPGRMVRAKLLHNFLWSYCNGLPDWDDAFSNGEHNCSVENPHSTLKSFSLSSAIECMPLELFLQVVGSDKKIENLVERCKLGLRLSDLPVNEYKILMDTLGTGRLSRVIDVLFRLKLIQLAMGGTIVDTTVLPHCASMYSLELKPYIEVPRSFFAHPPRLRHDFVLSNWEAVDSYWQTLEYCYVAADRKFASDAFPGSDVPEVFLARSWTSVRVMTAEQHMELLRRLKNHEPNIKVPFGECVKISRELELTLEQVLRVSYDMRRPRRRRSRKRANPMQQELNLEIRKSRSVLQKRKRHSKAALQNQVHAEGTTEETSLSRTSDEENIERMACCSITPGRNDIDLIESENDKDVSGVEDFRMSKEGASLKQCSLGQKLKRKRKFPWNDISDRELVIKYVKYRAPLGAKFSRVDWASIPDLPTAPDSCKRRMYMLNSNLTVRKAVLRLCNIVGGRYAKFLNKRIEDRIGSNDSSGRVNHDSSAPEIWDDFEDPEVKMAVDDVLRCKSLADLENAKRMRSRYEKNVVDNFPTKSSIHEHVRLENDKQVLSPIVGNKSNSHKDFPGPSDGRCSHACKRVRESLSVANAVELFKLVFLSTSTAPEVRTLLAETLNWYSEHDLTIAFNYLKEKKLMEHGHGSQQLFLSQRFLHGAYSSPFPVDSGKRAAKFATWLLKEEKSLMEDGINLNCDMQSGDVFHLCALLSSGRLSIAPCMPKEGIGEADDPKSSTCEMSEGKLGNDDKTAKQKVWWRKDNEPCNRREKGFAGIKLILKRRIIPMMEAMSFLPEKDVHSSPFPCVNDRQEERAPFQSSSALFSEFGSTTNSITMSLNDSLWESMASYVKSLSSTVSQREQGLVSPEFIKNVYNAIQQAGEQGLSIEEISEKVIMHGNKLAEILLDVLREFQLIIKVNAYDNVRVVDSSYKPKYFITILADHKQDSVTENSQQLNYGISERIVGSHENAGASESGKMSGESCVRCGHGQAGTSYEECRQKVALTNIDAGEAKFLAPGDTYRCQPILPWINGDGSINGTLYIGLVRRILGTVMQNPGILEEDLISQMDVLNPQSCRQLLELMILDNHIIRKKMHQTTSWGPPSILKALFGPNVKLTEPVFRKHYFANPMSTFLL